MRSFDVTIVGAGLAGLSGARELSSRGLRVLLVDRKADLGAFVHTTGIFVRRTFEDFDLPERLLGPPIRNVVLYSPSLRSMTIVSDHDEFRVGRMGLLYRDILKNCEGKGVVFSDSTRFVRSESSTMGSVVTLERRGTPERVVSRVLIGADGARSRVGPDLGLSVNREWIVGAEEVLDGVPLLESPALHCFLDPVLAPGYIAWVVQDGEQTHVGVGGYGDRFNPLEALGKFKSKIAGRFNFSVAKLAERRGGRIPVGGLLPQLSNGRGLLIGDAAGAVSPLTAGGFDGSMRLTRFAAEVIAASVRAGRPEILETFSGRHFRTRFISRRWMRRTLAALDSPAPIELACAVLRIPPFTSLARHLFFGRGSFPEPQPEIIRALAAVG